jgi:hypothetical protein
MAGYPVPPPPKHSKAGVVVGVIVLVIVLVIALVLYTSYMSVPSNQGGGGTATHTVDVTSDNWQFNKCWTSYTTGYGITVNGGSTYTDSVQLTYNGGLFQPASCTVQTVSIQTSGFSIVNVNTPLIIDAGGTQTLSITIQVPNADYTGAVNLVCTVSQP